ncbi:MAG: sulfurtransferase TusA family protein, partial [candidate division WOR-3 bacterium]
AYIVDARGLPCPQPVILTRKALETHDEVTTIVDNDTARENVSRTAEKAGYAVSAERREDGTYIYIRKGAEGPREVFLSPRWYQPFRGEPVALLDGAG